MKTILLSIALLTTASFTVIANELPDVHGALNPNVTQDNLQQTVCVSGYTKTIRPPVSYTNRLKHQLLLEITNGEPTDARSYELDHDVPLAVGGEPSLPENLWLQPRFGKYTAAKKDVLESYVHRELCKGNFTLKQARDIFLGDWRIAYDKYIAGSRISLPVVD